MIDDFMQGASIHCYQNKCSSSRVVIWHSKNVVFISESSRLTTECIDLKYVFRFSLQLHLKHSALRCALSELLTGYAQDARRK
jgi:hypothetical protein